MYIHSKQLICVYLSVFSITELVVFPEENCIIIIIIYDYELLSYIAT